MLHSRAKKRERSQVFKNGVGKGIEGVGVVEAENSDVFGELGGVHRQILIVVHVQNLDLVWDGECIKAFNVAVVEIDVDCVGGELMG